MEGRSEGPGVGEGSPFAAGGDPPLPAGGAPNGPLGEGPDLAVGTAPVDFVPDGFVDGRACPAQDIAGYEPGAACGRLRRLALRPSSPVLQPGALPQAGAAAHLRQTFHQSSAGQGALAGPTRPARSQLVTEAAAMTAAGWRGAPLTWKMTPMAGREVQGAHRPVETVREAACMMLQSW